MDGSDRPALAAAGYGALEPMDRQPLRDVRILLLEDDALISLDAEDMLLGIGAARVLVAHTVEEAEALLDRESVDVAVLDLVIGSGRCEDFARRLVARPLPVVFASGFGGGALPEPLQQIPTVEKPYSPQALHAALAQVLGLP